MRRFLASRALFTFLLILPCTFAPRIALAYTYPARTVGIIDGDTAVAAINGGQQRGIRLEGIDAPEHGQPFASESTEHLSALISGKAVNLDCAGEGSYGRLVCKILLPSGEDVDLDQIKAGMAWHYKQYQRLQTATGRAAYGAAEDEARRARMGLRADANPMQPQDLRHGTRSGLPGQ